MSDMFSKEEIKALVKSAFEKKTNDLVSQYLEENLKADDADDIEDDEDEEDEGDEDELEEALSVVASLAGKSKEKTEKFKVKNLKELAKLARTGKYDYFSTTKDNGDELEFMVEKGKLVEM